MSGQSPKLKSSNPFVDFIFVVSIKIFVHYYTNLNLKSSQKNREKNAVRKLESS